MEPLKNLVLSVVGSEVHNGPTLEFGMARISHPGAQQAENAYHITQILVLPTCSQSSQIEYMLLLCLSFK